MTVGSGGDCPELQLHGILRALDASLPNSYIYVFTNSNAKDVELIDDILSLIQKKSCQVVFILTGYCLNYDVQRDVYTEIAAASFGQVFYLNQYNVNEMLEMIRLSLKENTVCLISIDSPVQTYEMATYVIPVDGMMHGIMISLSGKSANIIITDSQGYIIQCSSVTRCLINLPNIKIIDVPNPTAGNWSLNITSESQYSLRASGTSEIYFRHGFSITPTSDFNETSHRPLKGCTNYILIRLTNCQLIENLKSIDIVSLNGIVQQTLYLNETFNKDGLYVTSFTPTDIFFFHIRITGHTKNGYLIQRITKTATSPLIHDEKCEEIQSKKWEAPAVSVQPSSTYFKKGDNVSILCSVTAGYPFPSVIWRKDNGTLYKTTRMNIKQRYVTYQNYNRTYLSIIDATMSDEGIYTCTASNMLNASVAAYAELRYYEFPGIKAVRNQLYAKINSNITLQCNVRGIPPPMITWFHGSDVLSCVTSSEKYEIFSDGKLTIRQYNRSDEGEYWCSATNIIGETFDIINLLTGSAPTFSDDRIYVQVFMLPNSSTLLKCQINEGCSPECSFMWTTRNYHCMHDVCDISRTHPEVRLNANENRILVKDPGIYHCTAYNEFGNATQVFNVTVRHAVGPKIIPSKDTYITLYEGDDYAIDCVTTEHPSTINWFFNSKMIPNYLNYQNENSMVLSNNTLLLMDVEENNAGLYTCRAENDIGKDSIAYNIRVIPENYFDYSDGEVVKAKEFQSAVLKCPNDKNRTEWLKNKLPLDMSNNKRVDEYHYRLSNRNQTLKIIDIHEPDSGIYTCITKLTGNTDQRHFRLYTLRTPFFLDDNNWNYRNITKASKTTLNCTADGFPPPMVKWLKIDKNKWPVNQWTMRNVSMLNRTKQTMTINYVSDEHVGIYRCVARNMVSDIAKYFVLKIG